MMDHTRLRVAGIKATFPRLKILDIFHQHADQHLSAADIYRNLISEHSSIGLATVYRVITQLEDAGLLKRTQLDSHSTVYELNDKGHHDHLVCRHCGRIQESSDTAMAQLVRKIARDSGFALDSYSLVLYGGCGCRKDTPAPSIGEFE
ncbi:Fur family transcriptional regulator [Achromobacter denitrificans]|nr:Fur family transcriptional regulator [Achromobacter denitrificans]